MKFRLFQSIELHWNEWKLNHVFIIRIPFDTTAEKSKYHLDNEMRASRIQSSMTSQISATIFSDYNQLKNTFNTHTAIQVNQSNLLDNSPLATAAVTNWRV